MLCAGIKTVHVVALSPVLCLLGAHVCWSGYRKGDRPLTLLGLRISPRASTFCIFAELVKTFCLWSIYNSAPSLCPQVLILSPRNHPQLYDGSHHRPPRGWWDPLGTFEWSAVYLSVASFNLPFTKAPVPDGSLPSSKLFSVSKTFWPEIVTNRKSPLWEMTSSEKLPCRFSREGRASGQLPPLCMFSSSLSDRSSQFSNS